VATSNDFQAERASLTTRQSRGINGNGQVLRKPCMLERDETRICVTPVQDSKIHSVVREIVLFSGPPPVTFARGSH